MLCSIVFFYVCFCAMLNAVSSNFEVAVAAAAAAAAVLCFVHSNSTNDHQFSVDR